MHSRTDRPFQVRPIVALVGGSLLFAGLLAGCILVVDGDGKWDTHHSHSSRHDDTIRGSGVSKTETRTVGDFRRVELNGGGDLAVTVGSATSLSVTADDNLLQYLVTEVRDGTLVIEMKPGSYSPDVGPKFTATVLTLEAAVIRGSGDVTVNALSGEQFSLEVAGSGNGKASGKVGKVRASISGSGDIRFGDLEAREATAEISGSGDIDVWATESLSASIAGSGSVTYKGDPPRVSKSTAGSGSIRKR